jgi:serine phosphatase RsbU (regulator of sigma subunit)/ligand-binding sensor domain-containing protein
MNRLQHIKKIVFNPYTIVFFLIIMLLGKVNYAQHERGMLPINNYTPKEYEAQPQNWAVDQNKNGIVYIGNNIGLLEFRGANSKSEKWKLYQVENGSNVRSLDIDEKGYIYVGASNEFGYFAPDSNKKGDLVYYSLIGLLDSSYNKTFEIWHTLVHNSVAYFACNNELFIYENGKLYTLETKRIKKLFAFNDEVFLASDETGLVKIENREIHKLSVSNKFFSINTNDKQYCDLRGFTQYDENSFLVISSAYSSLILKVSGHSNNFNIKPFKTKLDNFLMSHHINDISVLGEHIAVSTQSMGVFILDRNGNIINVINKTTGLQNNRVRTTYLDDQNFLWAILNDGISRIKLYSIYSRFPQVISGFDGKVEGITRFNGEIYIGGSNGLFKLDKNITDFNDFELTPENINSFSFSSFTQITHDKYLRAGANVWAMKAVKTSDSEVLLFSTDSDVLELDVNGNIRSVINDGPWCFHIDKTNPARVFLGLYKNGISSLYFNNGEWIIEGRIGDLDEDVYNITQDDNGNIWFGTNAGVGKLEKPVFENHSIIDPKLKIYSKEHGLPKDDAVICKFFDKKLLVGTGDGVFTYNADLDSFLLASDMGEWFGKSHLVFRLALDKSENLWSVVYSEDDKYVYLARTTLTAEGEYITKRLVVDEGERILSIYPDKEGVIWVGGDNGVFRINLENEDIKELPFRAYLNLVISNEDTLFHGIFYDENGYVINEQSDNLKPTVKYKQNNFQFIISSIGYNNEVPIKYSFYLEGDEDDWTNWDFSNSRRYSNLYEGHYILHVKAMDIFGNVSEITTYSFVVKPPWYRTILAYILYVIVFVLIVWGAIHVSTRQLQRIIRERTAEIREQKELIEEKNKDIMDSIKYAKRIQETILPPDDKVKKHFPESFILYKPRDIVSGDFYWLMDRGGVTAIAAADCTGHGVPGAFMSIMGVTFLNEIAAKKEVNTAAEVLNQLRANVIRSLTQRGEEGAQKDGMDIALLAFEDNMKRVQFAGAYNPLYLIRDGEIIEYKANRFPVGLHQRDDQPFKNHIIDLQKGDMMYIFSDGYVDQFGGPKGKKLMSKKFKELLMEIHLKPTAEQKEILIEENLKWRGEIEQVDDVIVIGIRV